MNSIVYSPDILERYEFALNQFEARRKWVEELQSLLLERAEVESAYSKSLQKLANSFEKYTSKHQSLEKGLSSIVMSVRSVILTQSEQAQAQSEQLKTDAIVSLKLGLKRQTEGLESLRQKAEFLKTELFRNEVELNKRKEAYYKNYKQYSKGLEQVAGMQIQQSTPLGAVLSENDGLMTASQTVLEKSINSYNGFLDQYFREIVLADQLTESMDDTRINLVKDALLKSLVYEISAIKNVEYDTNQVAKKIETYKRVDARPALIESEAQIERTMLSKLNFNNFLAYVHNECKIPGVDRTLNLKSESSPIDFSKEVNRQLRSFLDQYESKIPRKLNTPTKTMPALSFKEGEETVAQSRYYYGILNDIFFNQHQLNPSTIAKFKDTIESKEKEISIFSIALHSFSTTTLDVSFKPTTEKSISDLIFFVSFVLDKCEAKKDADLVQRCYMSFMKVCGNFLKDSPTIAIYRDSLKQHNVLRSLEFWASDSILRIKKSLVPASQQQYHQQPQSQVGQIQAQLKSDISRWRNLDFSNEFQIEIVNQVADALKIDQETRNSFVNLILDQRQSLHSSYTGEKSSQGGSSNSLESPQPSPDKKLTFTHNSPSDTLPFGMIKGGDDIDSEIEALGQITLQIPSIILQQQLQNAKPFANNRTLEGQLQKQSSQKKEGTRVLSSIVKEDAI